MTIAKYCYDQKMTAEEFYKFKQNIEATAQAIKQNTEQTDGMYYPINDILNSQSDENIKFLIINKLKKLGFEFIENYTLYRL